MVIGSHQKKENRLISEVPHLGLARQLQVPTSSRLNGDKRKEKER